MKNKKIIIVSVFTVLVVALIIFIVLNIIKKDNYYIKVSMIDKNSPDVVLTVYNNDKKVEVEAIYYVNGILVCSGNNLTTNKFNIKNDSEMKVVLKNNKEVIAKVVMEE